MKEIFANISDTTKQQAAFMFEMFLRQKNIPKSIEMLSNYVNTTSNEEEKQFLDFYFNMRLEELRNESNFN